MHFPPGDRFVYIFLVGAVLATLGSARADDGEPWRGPFGGTFNANFTLTTDYSYAGISNTQLGPAFQVGLDYRTPSLVKAFPLWIFMTALAPTLVSR